MKISLVVPVFNEEEAIPIFYKTVREFDALKQHEVEIVFVNDGSKDATESIISAISVADPLVISLSFTRNFGKEPALFAGLDHASGDAVIPIDVDLQDPIEVIPHLIEKWQSGADMVLAKRSDRSTDGRLKRKTAEWFYKLHNKISNPQIEENVGDFRLMSREVVENIKLIWTYIGLFVASVAFIYGAWMIIDTVAFGNAVRGYPSLIVSILFLGGVQLIGIGVLGEYIGRIYNEVKMRPRYLIKRKDTK